MAALAVMLLVAVGSEAHAARLAPVFIQGGPVAPLPAQPGTGLCTVSRVAKNPTSEFFPGGAGFNVNTFLDATPDASNPNARVSSVLRTLFDLSNNNTATSQRLSYGDYENSAPGCQVGGCDFIVNDTSTAFATRFRGYLQVTADMVGLPVHFGFYSDDAVVFTIYDNLSRLYQVINRPPELGAATWRTTNSVTFLTPGLYPVEVLYAEITEHAALEMSVLVGSFSDFEQKANEANALKLKDAGFTLVSPASFHQTESGRPSFPDLNQCQQCDRRAANTTGNNGCDPSYYCNGAALCAPCDSATFCGPSCSRCGGSTPLCHPRNGTFTCVECTEDSQCPGGRCDPLTNQCGGCNTDAQCPNGQHCDTEQHECRECITDEHCGRGQSCTNNTCQSCSTNDSCAGTSCNCCPDGLQCASPTPGAPPSCVECTNDTQCSDGKRCDTANGRCVAQVPECNTSERCGAQCAKCPTDRPYCLDGQVCVSCRTDLECGDGKFCLSGECASCTTNNRCGSRCEACPTETPICLTDGTSAGSSCVGCTEDSHCGPGGTCDPVSRTCSTPSCSVTCAEGALCNGDSCVECFVDAHCPCGGTCDTATNQCTSSCRTSNDCLGVEYCSAVTLECERGRRKPGTESQGGAPCCGATGETAPSGLALLLIAASFLLRRSRGVA